MSFMVAAALMAATVGEEYPIHDVLNAAESVCGIALARDATGKELGLAGWTPVVVEPGGWVDRVLRREREISGPDFPVSKVFSRSVSGRDLFAFVSSLRIDPDNRIQICSVQDPSADIDSAPDKILAWAGRPSTSPVLVPPDLERGFDAIAFMKNWKPGFDDGSDDTTIRYVPLKFGGVSGGVSSGLSYVSERRVGSQ